MADVLPCEIWHQIFLNLRFADLKNVIMVCKKFCGVISDSMKLMVNFRFVLTETSIEALVHSNSRKYQSIRISDINLDVLNLSFLFRLKITQLIFENVESSKDKLLHVWNAVSESLQMLEIRSLNVEFSDQDDVMNTINWKQLKSKTIEKLIYHRQESDPNDSATINFIEEQTQLQSLELDSHSFAHNPMVKVTTIKSLKLGGVFLNYHTIAIIINQAKNLEHLELNFQIPLRFYDEDEEMFCPTLKSFKYYIQLPRGDDDTTLFLEAFPNLEELDLSPCATDYVASAICEFNQKLKKLETEIYMFGEEAGDIMLPPSLSEVKIVGRFDAENTGSPELSGLFEILPESGLGKIGNRS